MAAQFFTSGVSRVNFCHPDLSLIGFGEARQVVACWTRKKFWAHFYREKLKGSYFHSHKFSREIRLT